MKLGYMAVGSFGTVHHLHDSKRPPRCQLMAKCGRQHCAKMYVDTKAGLTKHIGYIVAGEWFTVYEVHEWIGKV